MTFLITFCPALVGLSVRKLFYIFDLFERTTGPISTKLGTKHPYVTGFKFVKMKRHTLFQRKIIRIYEKILLSFKNLLKNQFARKYVTFVEASQGSAHVYSRVSKSLFPGVVWGHNGALFLHRNILRKIFKIFYS